MRAGGEGADGLNLIIRFCNGLSMGEGQGEGERAAEGRGRRSRQTTPNPSTKTDPMTKIPSPLMGEG